MRVGVRHLTNLYKMLPVFQISANVVVKSSFTRWISVSELSEMGFVNGYHT
jgi:hypothetical protein